MVKFISKYQKINRFKIEIPLIKRGRGQVMLSKGKKIPAELVKRIILIKPILAPGSTIQRNKNKGLSSYSQVKAVSIAYLDFCCNGDYKYFSIVATLQLQGYVRTYLIKLLPDLNLKDIIT